MMFLAYTRQEAMLPVALRVTPDLLLSMAIRITVPVLPVAPRHLVFSPSGVQHGSP